MYSPKRRLRLFRDPAFAPGPSYVNPSITLGSAVTTVAQSPFTGGGNSYRFVSSVSSFLTSPASTDWTLGTGDFTIEWFAYQTSANANPRIFSIGTYQTADIAVSIEGGTFYVWEEGQPPRYESSSAVSTNTWYHWAIVRQGGTTRVYRNGTLRGSSYTDSYNITTGSTALSIGNETTTSTASAFIGYITSFRWVKGLAVYTGNFTTPTSALTATASANPYGGANTAAIGAGFTKLLLVP
jgi:hypothetical protein